MKNKEKLQEEFEELTEPLMEWLYKNWNPHCHIVVDSNIAELSMGEMIHHNNKI